MKNDWFNSFEKKDLRIEDELQISEDNKYIEIDYSTWFDVDKKFGINVNTCDMTWVNLYGFYAPTTGEFKMEYTIDGETENVQRSYVPTDEENKVLVEMVEEYCMDHYKQTSMDFWFSLYTEYSNEMNFVCEKNGDKYQVRNTYDDVILIQEDENGKLKDHVEHKIELAYYGPSNDIANISIECMDCCEVIYSMEYESIGFDLEMC